MKPSGGSNSPLQGAWASTRYRVARVPHQLRVQRLRRPDLGEHDLLGCELVYRSERDDWILAMIASGLGFGFMPSTCATHPGVAVRPLVDPEFWREVNLVIVRGRPHSPAVGALVREAMRTH